MEDKAICSKVLACFELGVLFNPKVACLMASVACYSLGCYKPTVVCLKAKVACWSQGWFVCQGGFVLISWWRAGCQVGLG